MGIEILNAIIGIVMTIATVIMAIPPAMQIWSALKGRGKKESTSEPSEKVATKHTQQENSNNVSWWWLFGSFLLNALAGLLLRAVSVDYLASSVLLGMTIVAFWIWSVYLGNKIPSLINNDVLIFSFPLSIIFVMALLNFSLGVPWPYAIGGAMGLFTASVSYHEPVVEKLFSHFSKSFGIVLMSCISFSGIVSGWLLSEFLRYINIQAS
ncbi:MAG TPA: hypothetical protein ACFE0H_02270 [Elainellaceae cyanobacterium]